jgi:hypothetical protein
MPLSWRARYPGDAEGLGVVHRQLGKVPAADFDPAAEGFPVGGEHMLATGIDRQRIGLAE